MKMAQEICRRTLQRALDGPGRGDTARGIDGRTVNKRDHSIPWTELDFRFEESGSATEMKSPSLCVTIDVTLIITYKEESYQEITHFCVNIWFYVYILVYNRTTSLLLTYTYIYVHSCIVEYELLYFFSTVKQNEIKK